MWGLLIFGELGGEPSCGHSISRIPLGEQQQCVDRNSRSRGRPESLLVNHVDTWIVYVDV